MYEPDVKKYQMTERKTQVLCGVVWSGAPGDTQFLVFVRRPPCNSIFKPSDMIQVNDILLLYQGTRRRQTYINNIQQKQNLVHYIRISVI